MLCPLLQTEKSFLSFSRSHPLLLFFLHYFYHNKKKIFFFYPQESKTCTMGFITTHAPHSTNYSLGKKIYYASFGKMSRNEVEGIYLQYIKTCTQHVFFSCNSLSCLSLFPNKHLTSSKLKYKYFKQMSLFISLTY